MNFKLPHTVGDLSLIVRTVPTGCGKLKFQHLIGHENCVGNGKGEVCKTKNTVLLGQRNLTASSTYVRPSMGASMGNNLWVLGHTTYFLKISEKVQMILKTK